MKLVLNYKWVDTDLNSNHKIIGWKRIGFKRKEFDGYDEYSLEKFFDFDWSKTLECTNSVYEELMNIYNGIKFNKSTHFSVTGNFQQAFADAERYLNSLETAYTSSCYLAQNPDLLFIRKISSNNGGVVLGLDTRDVLSIKLIDFVSFEIENARVRPTGKKGYFVCPRCGSKVFKN